MRPAVSTWALAVLALMFTSLGVYGLASRNRDDYLGLTLGCFIVGLTCALIGMLQ